ncbi:oxidoreductase molybdopterin-binding protein [Salmonella enterica subsp. enterica serovar Choleraesuis]|nr:oxidoreductase molybdopterin-binding protein [Salmonella enterica subsp. enterica serovar Choleraesuis]
MSKNRESLNMNDKKDLLREASGLLERRLKGESRRQFLKMGLTLGGMALLTGCDISDSQQAEEVLNRMSRVNDRLQHFLFSSSKLAPVYQESQITRPFPFNAFYSESDIPVINGDSYRLELAGLIQDKRPWTLAQLHQMQQVSQITRHICVEGWSAIGRWDGVPFADFLRAIGADLTAKYVSFKCADDYYTSIDMATALHPQTLLALGFDGSQLPAQYGYPMKLRIPTKLGYKNPKHIRVIEVTNRFPGGYWEDQGYNWFGGS